MIEKINDGGAAFPLTETVISDRAFPPDHWGMSLRDYFAAKAMQEMCSGAWPDSLDRPEIAKRAYLLADCMIIAREQA